MNAMVLLGSIGVAVALLLPRREADGMVVRGEIVGALKELMVGVEKVPQVDQHCIKTRRRSKSSETTLAGRLYGYKSCHASQVSNTFISTRQIQNYFCIAIGVHL